MVCAIQCSSGCPGLDAWFVHFLASVRPPPCCPTTSDFVVHSRSRSRRLWLRTIGSVFVNVIYFCVKYQLIEVQLGLSEDVTTPISSLILFTKAPASPQPSRTLIPGTPKPNPPFRSTHTTKYLPFINPTSTNVSHHPIGTISFRFSDLESGMV